MRKTLFKKYITITSLVILISFLVMCFAMLTVLSQYWMNEKRQQLRLSAQNTAELTAYLSQKMAASSSLQDLMDYKQQLIIFLESVDAEILVADPDGHIQLYKGNIQDKSLSIPTDVMNQALNSQYSGEGTLNGVYDRTYYIVGVPITILDSQSGQRTTMGAVFAAYNAGSFNDFRMNILKMFLLVALAAFAVSFCVVWLFTLKLVQPLHRMASAAHEFGKGNFSARVKVTSSDEIGELSNAFNSMADSLASGENVRRSFIANVSHELKTPMTTIAGFIDGILDGTIPPEKQKYYLQIVSQEVRRLSRLVRTMLDLSRIDSGELHLRISRFDLTNTVLVSLISFEKPIDEKKIEIQGMENAETLYVDGDPDMIHQVVYNLIDNAVKFTDEGGYIRITIEEKPGRTIVAVQNSGAGIAPDELPMIFDRFYKTDKSRSRDKNGMGLGLFIVKTIIRLHGGDITATSVQNEYCRFEFWLPTKAEKPQSEQQMLVDTTESAIGKPEK